jgi:hypothetical protein
MLEIVVKKDGKFVGVASYDDNLNFNWEFIADDTSLYNREFYFERWFEENLIVAYVVPDMRDRYEFTIADSDGDLKFLDVCSVKLTERVYN